MIPLILIYIFVIIILFVRKNEKYSWLIASSVLALLSITSYVYPDLVNYATAFNVYNSSPGMITMGLTNNFLWAYLCRFFGLLGFNYRGMVFVLIFVNFFLMDIALKKFGCNRNKFFALFLIFPAIIQLIQFRYFTSTTLIFLSYSFFVDNEKRSNVISVILFLIAIFIHVASGLYILIYFCKQKRIDKKVLLILVVFFSLLFLTNMNSFINIAVRYLSAGQVLRYITNSPTRSSKSWILTILLIWLLCYSISTYLRNSILKRKIYINTLESDYKRIDNLAVYFNTAILLLLLTTPLLSLDRNYHRYLEMAFMLLYVLVSFVFKNRTLTATKLIFYSSLLVIVVFTMFVYTSYTNVLIPVFSFDGFQNLLR